MHVLIGPSVEQVRAAFPEFEPLEELGPPTGQKVVLKGRDAKREIVLKVPRKWLPATADEELLEIEAVLDARIAAEIRNLKKIKSDYFVEIVKGPDTRVIEDHRYAWYLEPYYSTSLRSRIVEDWKQPRVVELTGHLFAALGVLVEERIVHRDIKPENIVFREDGRPVLLDLGVSLFANEPTVTEEGTVAPFTKQYSAPEQWVERDRDGEDLDFRTDLFCVGLVAYELLTKQFPFGIAVADWPAYKQRVRKHEYARDPLTKVATKAMPDMIDRLLRPEPNARYRTLDLAKSALGSCA